MSTTTGTASDYVDLLNRLDDFLTATGHAWGKRFTGTGNGDLVEYLGTAASVAETFTITATSATSFSVVGSVSGPQGTATVGATFSGAKITFKLTAGTVAYQAGDVWTINTAQPWQRLQREGYADARSVTTNLQSHENLADSSLTTHATATTTTSYLEWVMVHPSTVRRVLLSAGSPASTTPTSFVLRYRDSTGDAWTTAGTLTRSWATGESAYLTVSTDPGAHKYWRLDMSGATGSTSIATVRLLPTLVDPSGTLWALDSARWAWQAPGLDGLRSIYVQGSTFWSTASDVYNIRWNVSRGWVGDGSWMPTQPGSSGLTYTNLGTTPITYWIVANGQRFILVTAHGGTTQVTYMGLGLPYEPPSVHAYPAICAATSGAAAVRYSDTSAQQRFPMDPGSQSSAALASIIVYMPSGQWIGGANRYASTGTEGSTSSSDDFVRVWPAWTGSASYPFLSYIIDNVGSGRPLIPCVIVQASGGVGRHWWGEYDGLFWTTGFGTASQSTVRQQGFDHLIVNNVFRTQTYNFGAVRLD